MFQVKSFALDLSLILQIYLIYFQNFFSLSHLLQICDYFYFYLFESVRVIHCISARTPRVVSQISQNEFRLRQLNSDFLFLQNYSSHIFNFYQVFISLFH